MMPYKATQRCEGLTEVNYPSLSLIVLYSMRDLGAYGRVHHQVNVKSRF